MSLSNLELTKPIKKLLNEIELKFNSKDEIIVVDSIPNYITGNNEVLDGNHRLAYGIENNKLENFVIYAVDYEENAIMATKSLKKYQKWVKENGKIVTDYKIVR